MKQSKRITNAMILQRVRDVMGPIYDVDFRAAKRLPYWRHYFHDIPDTIRCIIYPAVDFGFGTYKWFPSRAALVYEIQFGHDGCPCNICEACRKAGPL